MKITGETRLFGIVADPIAQVRTPEAMNAYFDQHGIDAVMVPFHLGAEQLEAGLNGLRKVKNLQGLIITVPHKSEVTRYCDELSQTAQVTGAVNAIHRTAKGKLIGDMFDGIGFVAGLKKQGYDPKGKKVVVLGAGGAASAIALALAQAGVQELAIINRSTEKAHALASRIQALFVGQRIHTGCMDFTDVDLIVNATSLGMNPTDPLPIDLEQVSSRTVVAEIIMKPTYTPLLIAAQQRGCAIHLGHHMLDEQVRLMARFMLGQSL